MSSSTPGTTPSPITTPATGGSHAEIELEITGGEYEGSYRAEAANSCASDPAQNTFTVSFADESTTDGFAALHLVLRDATQAQEDASTNFLAEIGLDGAANVVSYTLDPSATLGEGDAFLDVTDVDATLDLSATAVDGSIIDLTVICEFGAP